MPGNTCGFRPNYYTIDLQLSRRFFDSKTTVSTWHEEMILLAHTSYLFAQSRIGTYPPFWALGCSRFGHLGVRPCRNISTNWDLSVKNDCPVIGLICLKAHLYLFFVALFLSQRWKFLFGKISAFRCLDIFSEFASKNLA